MMNNEIDEIIEKYTDDIYRIAYLYLRSKSDAEDIVQEVFLKYMLNKKPFKDEEHRKNWLLKITTHICINVNKSAWCRKVVPLKDDDVIEMETEEQHDLLDALNKLNNKYKMVVQLFYFEGFTTKKISEILGISDENVRVRLNRARNELKDILEKEGEVLNGKI